MFYYLNEPTEGGETAFPFADNVTYDDSVRIVFEVRQTSLYGWSTAICDQVLFCHLENHTRRKISPKPKQSL
jgi:hypothetical protein